MPFSGNRELSADRLDVVRLLRSWGVECHTRREWGSPREADGSYVRRRGTHPMPAGPAPYHYLHITVTRDTNTIQEGAAGARQIEGYGYSSPPMVSYQDLVTNEGRYFQGQDYGTKGTHTMNDKKVPGFPENLNLYGYALALMQNVGDTVTDAQVDVAARVFAARELLGLVKVGAPVHPHRKFAAKSCPGDKAMARLPEIVALKNRYVQEATEAPKPEVANPTPLKVATFNIRSFPLMSAKQVEDDMRRVEGWADWYCFQELSPTWYRNLLKKVFPLPRWQMRRLSSGECMVWRNDRFEWGWGGQTKLNGIIPFVCGTRHANWMWVWDRPSGARLSFGDVHLPPKKNTNRRAARGHADGLARLRASIEAQVRKPPGRHIIIGGDWNCSSATIYAALGREIAGAKVTVINQPREDGRPAIDHVVLVGDFRIGHRHAIPGRLIHSDHLPFGVEVTPI